MPLPIFYLEFQKHHGREPKPSEMTLQQRRALRECLIQNRNKAQRNRDFGIEEFREAFKNLPADDPNTWHEILKKIPKQERKNLLMLIMRKTPKEVLRIAQQFFDNQDTDVEYWEYIIRETVGLGPEK